MRPRTLDEVVGQEHLLGPGSPLRRLVEGDAPMSLILCGPPGTGKTTLAHVVSRATDRRVRPAVGAQRRRQGRPRGDRAGQARPRHAGRQTVLFIDEIHRFSKTQQDSLLGAVEDRASRSSRRPPRTRSSRSCRRCCPARCCSPSQPLTDEDIAVAGPPGAGRRARPRRRGRARRRRRRAPAADGRRRRPAGADRAGGRRRRGPGQGRATGSRWRRWRQRSTGPRCATTATATSTTT